MPKSRSALRKKNKESQKTSSGISLHFLNKRDNAKDVVEWIESGDFDRESFAEHLPHTAKDISQGLLNYDHVNLFLQMTYIWTIEGDDTKRLRKLSSAIAHVVMPKTTPASARLTIRGLVTRMMYYKTHIKYEHAACIDMQASLTDVLRGIRSGFLSDECIREVELAVFQSGLPYGSFLRYTSLNKSTESQFIDEVLAKVGDVDEGQLWEECENMRRIANSCQYITGDYDPAFYTCWECRQVVETLQCCGGCKAALYCNRQCQVAAWKKGHKGKCTRLKAMHRLYVTGVDEMERAHLTGKIDGFELSPATDIHMMKYCFNLIATHTVRPGKLPIVKDVLSSFPRGPSMKYLYENLGRIIRGEWWVYDSSQDGDHGDPLTRNDVRDAQAILKRLALDWFGEVESGDPKDVTAYIDPFFRVFSAPISRDAFLRSYESDFTGRLSGFRPNFKLAAWQLLQREYNELK